MKLTRFPHILTLASIGMLLFLATTIFAQQMKGSSQDDQITAKLVAQMVEQYHISQGTLDDNISSKMLDRYIKDWDPQKLYLLSSDVTGWDKYRKELDNLIKEGQVDFAYDMFNTFLKRMDERLEVVHKLIDQEFDFSKQEELESDADAVPWATTVEELNERWRKRIKYELLLAKIDDKDATKAREDIHKKYRNFSILMHQFEKSDIMELFLSAMTHCFDPHSSYMSPRSMEDFQINMALSLEGIGAQLRSDDGFTVVADIISGGAADKDGRLKAGDKILAVGQGADTGTTEEMVDIVNMKLTNVVKLIRGKPGSIVRMRVKTESGEEKVYEMARQKIELTASAVKGEVINTQDRIGRPGKVGIARIPSFYRDFTGAQNGQEDFRSTAVDLQAVLNDFRKQNVDAVVVDLRWNGGGALSEAIDVSGLFIDKGPVVQIKQPNGKVSSHDDEVAGVAWNGPLIVICNRLSASASEIFAGVIKDYQRGIIVGDTTTHGKGTVQNVMPVSRQMFQLFKAQDRGALKLTIQQFYRVNGDSTQNRGVRSDIILPSKLDFRDLGESFLDNALPFDHIPPAHFASTNMVTPSLIAELNKTSQLRVSTNTKFQKLEEDIKRFKTYKDRKMIPLNEDLLRAEIKPKDGGSMSKDEEELVEQMTGAEKAKEIFPADNYNDEILNIAVDLTTAVHNDKTVAR
jgi:carboxyl-terminal processing protease